MKLLADGAFEIAEKIGAGSFGDIFLGRQVASGDQVCIKLERSNTPHPQLAHEAEVLSLLQGGDGIPTLYWNGEFEKVCDGNEGVTSWFAIVIELLGPTIEDLFGYCGRKFQVETVLNLSSQILARIEFCHSRGVILRDVKPANFLIGLRDGAKTVHAIDFGLASIDPTFAENVDLVGTFRFASGRAHAGVEQTRRDDLEALGYVIMYLLRAVLPWEKALENRGDHCSFGSEGLREGTQAQLAQLVAFKTDTPLPQLCEGFPTQLMQYMQYVRGLDWVVRE